jgi:transcription elongation factor GreA
MSFHPKLYDKALVSESRVYNRPHLLAGALHQLDRLAEKRGVSLKNTKRAGPGSVIDLLYLEDMERTRLELVMPADAAPEKGKISVLSLLGSNLLGLKKGDTAQIGLCTRSYKFQVVDIFQL